MVAYVLDPTASMTPEVRRVARQRLTEATGLLAAIEAHDVLIERAVHDVRKRCKEVRALARLVRSSLGPDFDEFNDFVRSAADALAPIRDAHAILATFDDLRASRPGDDDPGLDAIRSALVATADEAALGARGRDRRIERAHRLLESGLEQIDRWKIPNRGDAVVVGIAATYERGRRTLRRAADKPTDDRLHEWRKSVKTLWYQARLIERAAPSVLGALVASLDDLAEALGDDHDLAVLIDRLDRDPSRFGDAPLVNRAIRLARSQQDDLRRRAFRLGATIYAETPRAFSRRIDAYWKRAVEEGPELATGGIAELARDERHPHTPTAATGTFERERKFLVVEKPPLPAAGTELRQGYVAIDEKVSVRVREADEEGCTLTIKAGRGAVRTELEWRISDEQFAAAWEQTRGRRVHKTRYRLTLDGHVGELDVFHDELDGLLLVEVEFQSDDDMAAFEPPAWFGREVTDDVSYTNASLSTNGAPDRQQGVPADS
jgi:CYTH domain-containing protein/CHAD domain-containing protein